MSKQYKLAVMIGRFEPFHVGHISNAKQALELADNILFIIGSAQSPRTIKNPFYEEERIDIISRALETIPASEGRVHFGTVEDYLYNESKWEERIQEEVFRTVGILNNAVVSQKDYVKNSEIAIMGYEKDDSSYYLNSFPKWKFISIGGYAKLGADVIDATKIRELMFEGHLGFCDSVLHPTTFEYLLDFSKTEEFANLVEEYQFIKKYKKMWEAAPYPVQFQTVDAVVAQSAHVLLIKRGAAPGKGLWALPGGFLNPNETYREGALRELREETGIKVVPAILDANITYEKSFDAPNRSLRGRTISHAYLVDLPGNGTGLPKVKGDDDAAEARWFSFAEIKSMSRFMFEDHFSIVSHMIARVR
jgi:bifunctional NMN adenylyltransferase/nudix hydrolase